MYIHILKLIYNVHCKYGLMIIATVMCNLSFDFAKTRHRSRNEICKYVLGLTWKRNIGLSLHVRLMKWAIVLIRSALNKRYRANGEDKPSTLDQFSRLN